MSDEETQIEVRTDDIRDVLHWLKWPRTSWEGFEPDPLNARWLAEYGAADDTRKKGMLTNMEDSLAWVLGALAEKGPWFLWARLLEAILADTLSDIAHQNTVLNAHAQAFTAMTEELTTLRALVEVPPGTYRISRDDAGALSFEAVA